MECSVIICTHNPREEYLTRTLEALKIQTLPKECWELLLIDNASNLSLAEKWDLSWHPNGRHIRENELGLTPARLSGIKESVGGLLIFVDDDNVLASDYLETSQKIIRSNPNLAAIGGSTIAEYEVEPPPWLQEYAEMIAVRDILESRWSNNPDDFSSTPIGAGLVITRALADHYLSEVTRSPLRKSLDRCGKSLSGGGDIDLSLMSCDIGYGKGVFKPLRLVHLIPKQRMELGYLLRLRRSMASSIVLRRHLRGESKTQMMRNFVPSFFRRAINRLRILRRSKIDRLMQSAWDAGIRDGLRSLDCL